MKTLLLFFAILLSLTMNAKRINLNYEPSGQIIVIHYDSLTIITDSAALFSIYKDTDPKSTSVRLRNLIRREARKNPGDTLVFSEEFIPFNDSIDNTNLTDWYVEWAVIELTNKGKLKLYDKHGALVEKIKIGRKITEKSAYGWHQKKPYINRETKEVLFYVTIGVSIYEPIW